MRLIDADALYKEVEQYKAEAEARLGGVTPGNIACRLVYTAKVQERETLASLVAWMPTVDAVEVVRCKDCKHCDIYQKWNGKDYFGCEHREWETVEVDPNHFCGYGERREK